MVKSMWKIHSSVSLINKESQIKTTISCHIVLVRLAHFTKEHCWCRMGWGGSNLHSLLLGMSIVPAHLKNNIVSSNAPSLFTIDIIWKQPSIQKQMSR